MDILFTKSTLISVEEYFHNWIAIGIRQVLLLFQVNIIISQAQRGLWLTFSKVQRGPNFIQLLGFLAENTNIFGLGSWPIKIFTSRDGLKTSNISLHRVMDLKETLFFYFKDWAYGFYFLYIINWTHGLLLFLTGCMG